MFQNLQTCIALDHSLKSKVKSINTGLYMKRILNINHTKLCYSSYINAIFYTVNYVKICQTFPYPLFFCFNHLNTKFIHFS